MEATVEGISDYKRGQWSVVLRRKLKTSNSVDPVFTPGGDTSLILAIWNGEKKEVNGRKAVTYQWISATLEGVGSPTAKADVGVSNAQH
jgi:DMSO reductase family type II enzyme heme b subunit